MITRATAIGGLGRPKEGVALLQGAIRLAEDYDLPQATMRALNNLAFVAGADDAHAQEAAQAQLLDHAKRVGDTGRILDGGADLAVARANQGDLAGAVEILEEVDPTEVTGQWSSIYGYWLAFVRGLQTGETRYWEESERHLSFWDDSTDPQVIGLLAGFRTWACVYQGDYEGTLDVAAQSDWDPLFPFRIHAAVHAAAWLGDSEALAGVAAQLRDHRGRGRRIKGLRLFAEAAQASLAGDGEDAARLFEDAIALWEPTATGLELVLLQATFAKMVGQEHPAALAAATSAYQWVVESGSALLLDLLEEGLPAMPATGVASG
jgi:hypothetical protein